VCQDRGVGADAELLELIDTRLAGVQDLVGGLTSAEWRRVLDRAAAAFNPRSATLRATRNACARPGYLPMLGPGTGVLEDGGRLRAVVWARSSSCPRKSAWARPPSGATSWPAARPRCTCEHVAQPPLRG
jgi:hypothetical protein